MSAEEKVNILLVDDQPVRLLSYEAILRSLDHNIVRASSGSEALHQLMREDFAVILLDVNMPGMDGFETAEMIHQHPRYENTPIVFVTAMHVSDMDRLKGYALGAVDYVYIPVIPEILRSKVAVLIELYVKKRELVRLNETLELANAELALANSTLQMEKSRELEVLNATLASANADLERANLHLTNQINERKRLENALKDADRRKDEFIAMLAHELRNPLAAIANGLELMRGKAAMDSELTWSHGLIDRQVTHLCRLIEDLLDVSRIAHGKIKLRRQILDLAAIVTRAVEGAQPLIDSYQHQLSIELPNQPIAVDGDPTRLIQVVGNLLSNAVKYTPEGGHVRVRVTCDENEVLLSVKDDGLGFSNEVLPHLFELFSQLDRTMERSQGGLGIGLALVHRLVELHGGRVWANSDGTGTGAEFFVSLPRHMAALNAPEASPRESRTEASAKQSIRILVVDDNVDSADSLGRLLRHFQHVVETAHSGEDAIRIASEFDPELILLDLGMPGMNGYETARRIRELPGGNDIHLVALTGWSQTEAREATRRAGFNLHLVKPVDLGELQRLIDSLSKAKQRLPSLD